MRTHAGCECVAHALQALCEMDPELTILSIDGIAYDSISRVAMLQGLREVNGQAVLHENVLRATEHIHLGG